jgi:translation initiation factor IF-3
VLPFLDEFIRSVSKIIRRKTPFLRLETGVSSRFFLKQEVLGIAKPQEDRTRINEQIRVPQVRVIDDDGEQLGIMKPEEALKEAEAKGLDLVEVAPNANPPVCRYIDYGKFRYQQSKRLKEARKKQHVISLKEIKYRPKISDHDFDFKTNHVKEFLEAGNKVKLTIMFRGREMAHPEFGKEILQRVLDEVADMATDIPDLTRTRLEGRNMTVVISPAKIPKTQ